MSEDFVEGKTELGVVNGNLNSDEYVQLLEEYHILSMKMSTMGKIFYSSTKLPPTPPSSREIFLLRKGS